MNFRNRIVGYEEVDPEQLLANPLNWRIHPQAQQESLQGILEEVGWVDDIIVNKNTGFVVDGHLRVALAISNEEEVIPVKYVDLTEDEERLVLATIDPIAAMAVTDKEKLSEAFDMIESDNERVFLLLDNITKNEEITNAASPDKLAAWRAYNEKLRRLAVAQLGGACIECEFDDYRVLEIDHTEGGGVEHRREVDHKSQYRAIRDGKVKGYQLLCANCHGIKSYEERIAKYDSDIV